MRMQVHLAAGQYDSSICVGVIPFGHTPVDVWVVKGYLLIKFDTSSAEAVLLITRMRALVSNFRPLCPIFCR